MKKNILINTWFMLILIVVVAISGCDYKKVADTVYPDETLYLPSAVNGMYVIDVIAAPIGSAPVAGQASKYKIDSDFTTFTVPLAVYRAGISTSGNCPVDIALNTDTINTLINTGKLPNTEPLPDHQYQVDQSVTIADGASFAPFEIRVPIDFLQSNQGKRYAVALSISSKSFKVNSKLNTVIVVVDTKMLIPSAGFTYGVDDNDDKTIDFTNTSKNAMAFYWDFGDGKTSTEVSPKHSFTDYGNHTVSLIVTGVTGEKDTATQTFKLYQNVTATYFKNPGFPFLRSDNSTDRWGLLQDWLYTPNVLNQNGFTKGGFSNDDSYGYIHFESTDWAGPGITNGKVYQSFTLPPGDYRMEFTLKNTGSDTKTLNANFVVAKGNVLPDITDLNGANVLGKFNWVNTLDPGVYGVNFSITVPTPVSIGFVISFGSFSYARIMGIKMIK